MDGRLSQTRLIPRSPVNVSVQINSPLQFGQCPKERVFIGDIFHTPGVPVLLPASPHVYLDDDAAP